MSCLAADISKMQTCALAMQADHAPRWPTVARIVLMPLFRLTFWSSPWASKRSQAYQVLQALSVFVNQHSWQILVRIIWDAFCGDDLDKLGLRVFFGKLRQAFTKQC